MTYTATNQPVNHFANGNGHARPLFCPKCQSGAEGGRFCIRCGGQLMVWPGAVNNAQRVTPLPPQQFQPVMNQVQVCQHCGGQGQRLEAQTIICPKCKWLRPLAAGYVVDPNLFMWAEDGQAMATLRSIAPLNAAAQKISDRAGKKWIETTFNGVRLSEKQMPHVYAQAMKAARLLGLPAMPDVYVSGERPWDALTFGSDTNAFIVIGSSLVASFQGEDLLYILAREMGHVRAGHALWKTVIRFLVGEVRQGRGMGQNGMLGIVGDLLSPGKWIENAIELPLLAWARQAEITADRAGLLAVGSEDIARRVLMSWALRSPLLYRQINIAAWMEQQEDDAADQLVALSEIISASTPFLARRLRLMTDFARNPHSQQASTWMRHCAAQTIAQNTTAQPQAAASNDVRFACPACKAAMRIPQTVLSGKGSLNVRCPNPACGNVVTLRKKAPAPAPAAPVADAD